MCAAETRSAVPYVEPRAETLRERVGITGIERRPVVDGIG